MPEVSLKAVMAAQNVLAPDRIGFDVHVHLTTGLVKEAVQAALDVELANLPGVQKSGKSDLPLLKIPPAGEWKGQVLIAERNQGFDVTTQLRGFGIKKSFPGHQARVTLAWGEICQWLKIRGVDLAEMVRTLPERDDVEDYVDKNPEPELEE